MPKKSINLTGTEGQTYNLDDLAQDTRTNEEESLVVQIWYWSPFYKDTNPHSKPNPPKPALGSVWLSKLVERDSDLFKKYELDSSDTTEA